jgi:hypothetical protein
MCNDEKAEGGRAGNTTYPTTTTFSASAMMTALVKQRWKGIGIRRIRWPLLCGLLPKKNAAEAQQRDAVAMWVRDVAVSWCGRLIGLLRWT